MSDGIKDVLAGSVAGIVGKIVEYPFDTVKVRLQSQSLLNAEYRGALDCLQKSIRNDGVSSLYKGISLPIFAASVENAVLFSVFKYVDQAIGSSISNTGVRAAVSGGLCGIAASYVLTPIELVKCRIQVNTASQPISVKQVIAETWQSGGLQQFWRGQMGTLLRECGGGAAWFGTYHSLREKIGPLAAGACAGIGFNLSLYPADLIKSRLQTEALQSKTASVTFWQTGQEIFRHQGIRGLYRGCLITCLRAVPSNAVIFVTYEKIRGYLH